MPNKKHSNYKKEYLFVVIVLIGIGVGLLWLSSAFNSSIPVTPALVTYHVGDQIGSTRYVLSAIQGTGLGENTVYAVFGNPEGDTVMQDVNLHVAFSLGGSMPYAIISYGTDYVVLQEVVPMPV